MTKNVPEWFPHPENLLRVVKRTGMSRVGALSLLEKCRDGKGTFPGSSADDMEAYAMTAWVMHLGKQLKAFDSKLEVKGRVKTPVPTRPSMFAGWFGRGTTKEGEASLDSLHQEWVKGGKVKGASHESFFDTEYLLEEIKLQRETLTKFNELWGGDDGVQLDEAREEEIGELLELLEGEDLQRPCARKVILVMGPIGNDRAKRTAKIVQAICSWAPPAPGSPGDIPEELAIAAAEGEGVDLRPWQVRIDGCHHIQISRSFENHEKTWTLASQFHDDTAASHSPLPPPSGPTNSFSIPLATEPLSTTWFAFHEFFLFRNRIRVATAICCSGHEPLHVRRFAPFFTFLASRLHPTGRARH